MELVPYAPTNASLIYAMVAVDPSFHDNCMLADRDVEADLASLTLNCQRFSGNNQIDSP